MVVELLGGLASERRRLALSFSHIYLEVQAYCWTNHYTKRTDPSATAVESYIYNPQSNTLSFDTQWHNSANFNWDWNTFSPEMRHQTLQCATTAGVELTTLALYRLTHTGLITVELRLTGAQNEKIDWF